MPSLFSLAPSPLGDRGRATCAAAAAGDSPGVTAEGVRGEGPFLALRLSFALPSSCYATMVRPAWAAPSPTLPLTHSSRAASRFCSRSSRPPAAHP